MDTHHDPDGWPDDRDAETPLDLAFRGIEDTPSLGFECHRVYAAVRHRLFADLEPPQIGRFQAIRRLGAGGMGEVYLCEDRTLGRKVAVKRVAGGSGSARAQEQLRHEARALAKFSHENIVQVHEIGEHEGTTFIAMEFVEGQTLGAWLRDRPRPLREVYEHFMAAGQGLAAAHARGIVHRDFKPDNVLMGETAGKIKVADFGLVLDQRAPMDEIGINANGLIVGTPMYMSPEQLRGEAADARSDQFAFCLAFYEGIWGEAPFATRRFAERLRQLERGLESTPNGHRALFRVIERGLEPDPAQRWPDMDALLAALCRAYRGPRRRRRQAALALGIPAALAASFVMLQSSADPALTCKTGLEGVWDAAARARVERRVETLDASHVEASRDRVFASLDRWAEAWGVEHAQVCALLTPPLDRVIGQDIDARNACLVLQAAHVEELVRGLERGDADTLAAGVIAASSLPRPRDCSSPLARLGVEPPPAILAAAVELQRTKLEAVHALRVLGRLDRAAAEVRLIDLEARSLDYAPLQAEARAEFAKVEDEGGQPQRAAALYTEAIRLAQTSRHDGLVADLSIERLELSLHELRGDPAIALRFENAEAAQERVGASDRARARLAFAAGRMAEQDQDYASALQHYSQASELAGDETADQPYYLGALADVTASVDERVRLRERALELARELFGPRHPRTALLLYNYGAELASADRDGEPQLRMAEELFTESLDSSPRHQAKVQQRHAQAALRRGELDSARRHALDAARILDESLAADHPERGEPELLLARITATQADHADDDAERLREQAIAHAQRAIHLLEAAPPGAPPSSHLAALHELLANQLMTLGRFVEAERALERASHHVDGGRLLAVLPLRRAELALRRGELEDAAHSLRSIEAHVDLLGAEEPNYALLSALVDLRLGQLSPARLDALRDARGDDPRFDSALRAWLVDLGASSRERARLGFEAEPTSSVDTHSR